MEEIFNKYDFKNATDKTEKSFDSDMSDIDRAKINKPVVLGSLKVLEKRVCVEGFPAEKSPGGNMAKTAFLELFDSMDYLCARREATPKDFYGPLFGLLTKLIASGPGTVHLQLIQDMFNLYEVNFKTHLQSLGNDPVKKLAAVCKREYSCDEDISHDHYVSKVKDGMACVLKTGLSDEQVKNCKSDLFDLYTFFATEVSCKDEREREMYNCMAEWISTHLGEAAMKELKGGESDHESSAKQLSQRLKNPKFQTDEAFLSEMDTDLSAVINQMKDEDVTTLKKVYKDLLDFCVIVFEHGTKKKHFEMAVSVNKFLFSTPQKGLRNKDFLVTCLTRMKSIITSATFPKNEDALDYARQCLSFAMDEIEKTGAVMAVYREVVDLLTALFDKKPGSNVQRLVERIGTFFSKVKEEHLKGDTAMFEIICNCLVSILEGERDNKCLSVCSFSDIVTNVLLKVMSKPQERVLFFKLLKSLLRVPLKATVSAADNAVRHQEKTIPWKEHVQDIIDIFTVLKKVQIPETEAREELSESYGKFTGRILSKITKCNLQVQLGREMAEFALGAVEKKNTGLYATAGELADSLKFHQKKDRDFVVEVYKRLNVLLSDDSYPWLHDKHLHKMALHVAIAAHRGILNDKSPNEKEAKAMVAVLETCLNKDLVDPRRGKVGYDNVYYAILRFSLRDILYELKELEKRNWAESLVDPIMALFDHEDEDAQDLAEYVMMHLVEENGIMISHYMETIIKVFYRLETRDLMMAIYEGYRSNPEPVIRELPRLIEYLQADHQIPAYVKQLIHEIAKTRPELLQKEVMQGLIQEAKEVGAGGVANMLILEDASKRAPEVVGQVVPELIDDAEFNEWCQPSRIGTLKMVGIGCKEHAETIMDHFCKKLTGPGEELMFICLMDGIRNVGPAHPDVLAKHKELFERVQKMSKFYNVREGCKDVINLIEKRSLETVDEGIQETKQDVEILDVKASKTNKKVQNVSKEVTKQTKEVKTVKKDVKAHGGRIKKADASVTKSVAKVAEIDKKTLNNAPFWSRDVSKLLNSQAEQDWKKLSSRLGYSSDDIRGWAQHHDPCMAMLNEWYAVRKTSDATFAVLTALQEMDRMDAAVIVENAMKMADKVAEDEDFEYPEPPEVFISYQWGMQNEVKLLKQHLEKAGYNCWMDVGQMGGGDKLFQKIDKGIRASKVIISCLTEKYTKSPNCNREVNLAVSLGKPLIPLLMEKQAWPPPGSMGPIFSEYLFIRFFTRPGETSGDDRYWSPTKFQELLMQLNYNGIVPDGSKVEKMYKNWWIPVAEEIKIDKKNETTKPLQDNKGTKESETEVSPPDVFISYQWGKQKQVMLLYRRLINLGFTSWMDIYQMGGGDSLYDKIDRGVRGCKIVLSCVTTKYSLSANCRREVSLADALKKPIVPLLLEKITWPPTGPMSMVFTQLIYINFSKDEKVQETWVGDEFDELLRKIEKAIPFLTNSEDVPLKTEHEESMSKNLTTWNATQTKTPEHMIKEVRDDSRSKVQVRQSRRVPQTSSPEQSTQKEPVGSRSNEHVPQSQQTSRTGNPEQRTKKEQVISRPNADVAQSQQSSRTSNPEQRTKKDQTVSRPNAHVAQSQQSSRTSSQEHSAKKEQDESRPNDQVVQLQHTPQTNTPEQVTKTELDESWSKGQVNQPQHGHLSSSVVNTNSPKSGFVTNETKEYARRDIPSGVSSPKTTPQSNNAKESESSVPSPKTEQQTSLQSANQPQSSRSCLIL